MKQSGLNLDIVSNGAEAIEALSKTDYALVLMDCLMPVMGGAETTRLIRSGTTNARNCRRTPKVHHLGSLESAPLLDGNQGSV